MIVYALVAHLQNLTLSVSQCWSPRYNVLVLFPCGGYHPSRLIVANWHKSKRTTIITTIVDLTSLYYFHLHNFYTPV